MTNPKHVEEALKIMAAAHEASKKKENAKEAFDAFKKSVEDELTKHAKTAAATAQEESRTAERKVSTVVSWGGSWRPAWRDAEAKAKTAAKDAQEEEAKAATAATAAAKATTDVETVLRRAFDAMRASFGKEAVTKEKLAEEMNGSNSLVNFLKWIVHTITCGLAFKSVNTRQALKDVTDETKGKSFVDMVKAIPGVGPSV